MLIVRGAMWASGRISRGIGDILRDLITKVFVVIVVVMILVGFVIAAYSWQLAVVVELAFAGFLVYVFYPEWWKPVLYRLKTFRLRKLRR